MENQAAESFRDHIGTIDEQGKRRWIYAQKPKGPLYNLRTVTSFLSLVLFFGLPFMRLNGDPVFMLNVIQGKFILFGSIFWPQDFFLFGLGMVIFVLFIALFTIVFGRVFCGWACPQTIFMEMIFRRIEYWVEGDANHQRALNKAPWTSEKMKKKTIKGLLFFFVSFIISCTFIAYIIGTDELLRIVREPFSAHVVGWVTTLSVTAVFYGVYSRFREQICLVVCPYGRLQGVLLDRNSILVVYDYLRGEKRGHIKKNEKRVIGDCIDCEQCVKVCPMGIDIRNGTQLECTSCTACIDACDYMMEKVGLQKGLIRYDSENGIANKQKLRITARMIAYSAVLVVLVVLEVFLLAGRSDIDTTVNRARGLLYQEIAIGKISNLYSIQLANKTHRDIPVQLKMEPGNGKILMIGKDILVVKEGIVQGMFFVVLDRSAIKKRKTTLEIGIYSGNRKIKTVEASFLGPVAR